MTDVEFKEPRFSVNNLLFYGFLLLYVFFLFYTAYKINISEDEAYTLNTTSRSLAGVIRQSYYFENQPPVYFILFSWWRYIFPGIFFARLFSIFFIFLSAYFFYRLTLLFLNYKCSKWTVVIFLLNPFTVRVALYMRTYALLIFLSTIANYLFFRYYFEGKKKFLYLFLIISAIGIYTQYFFIFLIVTFGIILLIFKGRRFFFKYCIYLIPILLLLLPNLSFLSHQIDSQKSSNTASYVFPIIFKIAHTPQNLALGINLLPNVWINRIVRIIFLTILLFAYLKLYKNLSETNLLFKKYNIILLSIFILMVFFSIGFLIAQVGYTDHYLVIVFPLFILLFTIFENYSHLLRVLIYSSIAIYFITLLSIQYRHPVNIYDYKSTAKYISKIQRLNEPILVYRPAIALPLNYYYHKKNKIIPIPYPVNFDSSYLINIKDSNELKQSIKNIKTTSKSYILISDTTIYEGCINMNRKMVTDFLNHHYNVTLDTLFYGWGKGNPFRIRRFEIK